MVRPSLFWEERTKTMRETIHLSKPIEINGKTYKELTYDCDEITPGMFNRASALATASNRTGETNMSIMELDSSLHMYLGMMAITAINPEIDIQDLQRIKGMDIVKVVVIGRSFIVGSVGEPLEESNSDEPSDGTPEPSTPVSKK